MEQLVALLTPEEAKLSVGATGPEEPVGVVEAWEEAEGRTVGRHRGDASGVVANAGPVRGWPIWLVAMKFGAVAAVFRLAGAALSLEFKPWVEWI
jgi:hypothetical protein